MAELETSLGSKEIPSNPENVETLDTVGVKENLEKGNDTDTPVTPMKEVSKSSDHETEKHGGPESEYESAEEEESVEKDLNINVGNDPDDKNISSKPLQSNLKQIETKITEISPQNKNSDIVDKVETLKTLDSSNVAKESEVLKKPVDSEKAESDANSIKVVEELSLEKLSIDENKSLDHVKFQAKSKPSEEENEKVNELVDQISNLSPNCDLEKDNLNSANSNIDKPVENFSESNPTDGESLNEFLDDEFNISGEIQGDLLDEEGHEGGIEERAELGEEFLPGDENSLLEEIDVEKVVTIENGMTLDAFDHKRDSVSPNEKSYVQEDGEYDEEEETLDDEEGEECVEGEREQGDGEESTSPTPNKEKVLDDDEDRRNPQYIPKKGAFYEHDDRLTSDQEQAEEEKEAEVVEAEKLENKKKKLWQEDGRWNHDMFNQDEQAPKSRDELLNSYGYDIRSEDCPPRARRRRRYGRGPNKYTRNWKDEDAYHKGGSESGQESESDGRKGSFRQPARRGRKNERGVRRGRGRMNNRRRQSNDNGSEEEDGEEQFDQENPQDYTDKKNNNEPPVILDKDFPPLAPAAKSTNSEEREKINESNIMNFRGTKAPFPPAQTLKSPSMEKEEDELAQSVRTLTFENSRFNNNRQTSNEMKPNTMREEERVDTRNFDRGNQRPGRGRGRGRESFNAMKGKGENYNQRPNGRGYPIDKNRTERPYRPIYNNQRNQFADDIPSPRPKSREEEIDEIMSEIPHPTPEEIIMPHNLKSHPENRPKRYSSLRQSRVPEGNPQPGGGNYRQNAPPPRHSQNQQYYEKPNYKAAPVYPDRMSGSNNPPINHNNPVNPMITGSPMYTTYNTPYQEPPFAMRPSLSNAPRMYPPPPAQPVALTPPYLTQAPQTSPAIINYVPGPNHPAHPPTMIGPSGMHQYPYQQYNGPPPTSSPPVVAPAGALGATVVVSQPQEVYRGGVTYYNTQSQLLSQATLPVRMHPQRRAKAAIPIVDPTQESIAAAAAAQSQMRGSYPGSFTSGEEMAVSDGSLPPASYSLPVET